MVKTSKKEYKLINIIFSIVFFGLAGVALLFSAKSGVALNVVTGIDPNSLCHPDERNPELDGSSLAEQTNCLQIISHANLAETRAFEIEALVSAFAGLTFIGFGFLGLKHN